MVMKPKIYIETTVISYLTAYTSRNLIRAAHQQITKKWWESRRQEFDLFVSETVLQEASGGDPQAAADRLNVVKGISILKLDPVAVSFAQDLMMATPLPKKASVDALHIAIAVFGGMDYLLTWNCSHIANATFRSKIDLFCRSCGLEPPVICTPEELLEK